MLKFEERNKYKNNYKLKTFWVQRVNFQLRIWLCLDEPLQSFRNVFNLKKKKRKYIYTN